MVPSVRLLNQMSDNVFYPLDAEALFFSPGEGPVEQTLCKVGAGRFSASLISAGEARSRLNPLRTALLALLLWLIGSVLADLFFPISGNVKFSVPSSPDGYISRSAHPEKVKDPRVNLSARVLLRLEEAEGGEPNAHFRDDYRISWITCLYAWRGEPQPHTRATYAVLGLHPDQVWEALVERRKALLTGEFPKFYDPAGNSQPSDLEAPFSPKKPARSVGKERDDSEVA